MDPASHHAEPFGEALSHSSQRAAQLVSLVAAAAEVAAHRRAAHNDRQAAHDEQARRALWERERAARQQARAGWAPAHDARWLAQAGLLQAARTWSAAAPYAGTEPAAAAAMRQSEDRLRALHPYAMGRYDRLRSEGASPPDAMREAAPLFARQPHARPGPPATRLGIGAGPPRPDSWPEAGATDNNHPEPAPDQDPYQDAERRGRQIAQRLQARAQAERGAALPPDELATALAERTTLHAEVIARLTRADIEERVAAGAERARAADLDHADDHRATRRDTLIADTASAHESEDRAVARLAAESFPCTAADGIRAAVTGSLQQPARPAPRMTTTQNTRCPAP